MRSNCLVKFIQGQNFGFSIEDSELCPKLLSQLSKITRMGLIIIFSGFYGSYVDIEGEHRTEFDLIKDIVRFFTPRV